MVTLQLLATTLGLATLAGINLYLTVFVTGLSINMGWLTLSPDLQALAVLGDPVIVTLSGILYFLEFFADKVRGFDVVWDTIHTAIRPLGAAFIGLSALGQLSPQAEIMAVLMCGTLALGTHAIKAGTRVLATVSPIPFTGAALSVGEDIFVIGGLLVAFFVSPWILVGFGVLMLGVVAIIGPWWYRQVRTTLTYLYALVLGRPEHSLGRFLPEAHRNSVRSRLGESAAITFALPVFIGGMKGWARSQRAWLVLTENPRRLILMGMRSAGQYEELALDGESAASIEATLQRHFLCTELSLFAPETGRCWVVRCPQDRSGQLQAAHRQISTLPNYAGAIGTATTPVHVPALSANATASAV
ncbi:MAG: DUF4126 domain-containing protein [Candidatus Methylacidiphilales bacterium]|nr:DUF4126 domain-containing protein [Candidatus Methylacidiphilales bacterium]